MKTYLQFSGWIELDKFTMMDYTGLKKDKPLRMTLEQWMKLDGNERDEYVVSESFEVLYRDCGNYDFDNWDLVVEN